MSARGVDRRGFLVGAVALAAAPAALSGLGCERRETLLSVLGSFFSDAASARAVGEAFLLRFPAEGDPERLVRRLARSEEREAEWEGLAAADPGALRAALREQHRADFGEGRVDVVNGWVLSVTEVRLYALAAALA